MNDNYKLTGDLFFTNLLRNAKMPFVAGFTALSGLAAAPAVAQTVDKLTGDSGEHHILLGPEALTYRTGLFDMAGINATLNSMLDSVSAQNDSLQAENLELLSENGDLGMQLDNFSSAQNDCSPEYAGRLMPFDIEVIHNPNFNGKRDTTRTNVNTEERKWGRQTGTFVVHNGDTLRTNVNPVIFENGEQVKFIFPDDSYKVDVFDNDSKNPGDNGVYTKEETKRVFGDLKAVHYQVRKLDSEGRQEDSVVGNLVGTVKSAKDLEAQVDLLLEEQDCLIEELGTKDATIDSLANAEPEVVRVYEDKPEARDAELFVGAGYHQGPKGSDGLQGYLGFQNIGGSRMGLGITAGGTGSIDRTISDVDEFSFFDTESVQRFTERAKEKAQKMFQVGMNVYANLGKGFFAEFGGGAYFGNQEDIHEQEIAIEDMEGNLLNPDEGNPVSLSTTEKIKDEAYMHGAINFYPSNGPAGLTLGANYMLNSEDVNATAALLWRF